MKKREISTISFFLEKSDAPLENYETGYFLIKGEWFRLRVTINGVRPDCPAIEVREFYRMLEAPGDYEPFTCTCGIALCADIDHCVRCRHRGDQVILFIRNPLRSYEVCADGDLDRKFRYQAYIFRRQDMEISLRNLKKSFSKLR